MITERDTGLSTVLEFCIQLDTVAGGLNRDVTLFLVVLNQNTSDTAGRIKKSKKHKKLLL